MNDWSNFFLGQLGAASALAGLLFVSISVNQQRLLTLGRVIDRGLESLSLLFMVMVVASLGVVPDQSPRLLGIEIAGVALVTLAGIVILQRRYLAEADAANRRKVGVIVQLARLAVATIAASGLMLAWFDHARGLYLLVPGVLLTFAAVGAITWVLLVEINR